MAGATVGTRLVDKVKFVKGFAPATPSTSTSAWVDLEYASHLTIVINVLNATTVTGSAITLSQATAIGGTSAKSLAFTTYFQNLDVSASDALTTQTAVSSTFTTLTTNSKSAQYIIEINATDLDINNSFTCVQVALATGTAVTADVLFIVSGLRYGGNVSQNASAVV